MVVLNDFVTDYMKLIKSHINVIFNITLILSTFLFINIELIAQDNIEEIKLKSIKGIAIGTDNESISQITQRAINEAKIEALKRAGVEENISSYTNYFQSENNNTYEELFASDILSDIRGAVKAVDIIDTKRTFDEHGKLNVEVTINCTVVKYNTNKDLSFDIWIDGIGMFYLSETKLIFRIKPTRDTYVHIFLFNETESYQMFPSKYEVSFLLKEDNQYNFPTNAVDYILYTDKKSEAHRMIMVFTKDKIPYTGKINYKHIIDWIFSIPPDLRIIKSFAFNVIKGNKITD